VQGITAAVAADRAACQLTDVPRQLIHQLQWPLPSLRPAWLLHVFLTAAVVCHERRLGDFVCLAGPGRTVLFGDLLWGVVVRV
jgi:hypothetical protein